MTTALTVQEVDSTSWTLSVPEVVAEEWKDEWDKIKPHIITKGKLTNSILRNA